MSTLIEAAQALRELRRIKKSQDVKHPWYKKKSKQQIMYENNYDYHVAPATRVDLWTIERL